MKITNKWEDNNALFYTIELNKNIFVDIKFVNNLCYIMSCEDGCLTYNNSGNSCYYSFNEDEVINFVKKEIA